MFRGCNKTTILQRAYLIRGDQFKETLEYKLSWRNAELIEIGRYELYSKMCSKCGT
ncbi:MAG: hypothetical protein QXT35_00940 [Conexivisphaerales archaeon]